MSGLFYLREVDEIGVFVNKMIENTDKTATENRYKFEDDTVFVPWGSVTSMYKLFSSDE